MRIWCAVGTRPEIIKMEPVIRTLRESGLGPRVIYTGQHPDLAPPFFKEFGLTINETLGLTMYAKDLAGQFSVLLSDFTTLLDKAALKPQVVLAVGDTTTAAAVALGCFNMRIPFGHIEAGLRTYDNYAPYPEELYRRIADAAATHRFAATESAFNNLKKETLPSMITGNTIIDVLEHYSRVWGLERSRDKLVLLTCHRREAFGTPMTNILRAVNHFAQQNPDYRILFPAHPNSGSKDMAQRLMNVSNIEICAPLGYKKFLRELARCAFVITDSGGLQEEASFFGKHIALVRETTERLEAVDAGLCHICGHRFDDILAGITAAMNGPELGDTRHIFGDGKAATRITEALL